MALRLRPFDKDNNVATTKPWGWLAYLPDLSSLIGHDDGLFRRFEITKLAAVLHSLQRAIELDTEVPAGFLFGLGQRR